MTMTGKRKRNGLTSIALVSRAQEMSAVLGLARGDDDMGGEDELGTSHNGVANDRPERSSKKVIPNPVDLRIKRGTQTNASQ